MKTIGIDARFYGEAGPGRYVKNVLEHLEKIDRSTKYVVFLRPTGFNLYNPANKNFSKVIADYKWYTWGEQIGFLLKLISYRLDLLYVPHFNFPILYPGKLVTAIPDLIMHTYSTDRGTTLPKPYFRFKKAMYKAVVLLAVLRSLKVIVPSQDVLNDFLKVFPKIKKQKYIIAMEAVDEFFLSRKDSEAPVSFQIPDTYLLYISSMYEHKNVQRLVYAYKILKEKYNTSAKLLLIGKKDKYSLGVAELVTNLGMANDIFMPGNRKPVSDLETIYLRKHALAYVFPSLKEGFSLTPMEAQSLGLPCVISDIPVHKEIYKDTVAYFNPMNTADMAEKIAKVIEDDLYRNSLREKGLLHYQTFSWNKTAQITKDVFDSALGLK